MIGANQNNVTMRVTPIRVLILATIIVASATLWSDVGPAPESPHIESRRTYINHEFGFSVDIPFYAPTCDPSDDSQETGFVFFLDHGGSDCALGMPDRRWISYHETYNAADFTGPEDVARRLCEHGQVLPTDANLFGELAQRYPWTCVEQRSEGLELYALYGLSEQGVIEHAYLQTWRASFDADRALFLATMRSLRRITPDPDDVRGTGWSAIWHREIKKEEAEAGAQEQ